MNRNRLYQMHWKRNWDGAERARVAPQFGPHSTTLELLACFSSLVVRDFTKQPDLRTTRENKKKKPFCKEEPMVPFEFSELPGLSHGRNPLVLIHTSPNSIRCFCSILPLSHRAIVPAAHALHRHYIEPTFCEKNNSVYQSFISFIYLQQ